jgi:hypothetical protein
MTNEADSEQENRLFRQQRRDLERDKEELQQANARQEREIQNLQRQLMKSGEERPQDFADIVYEKHRDFTNADWDRFNGQLAHRRSETGK